MKWVGHVANMENRRGAYRCWWRNLREKAHIGRPRHRWEDSIKKDLQEMGLEAWTGLIWLRTGTGG